MSTNLPTVSVRKREITPPTSSVTAHTIAAVFSLNSNGKFDAIGGADENVDADIRDWLGVDIIVSAFDESCRPAVETASSREVEMMSTR